MHTSTGIRAAVLVATSAISASALTIASPSSALSCPSSNGTTYTLSGEDAFTISCALDGQASRSDWTSAFASCIDTCESTSGCVAASYNGTACHTSSVIDVNFTTSDSVWKAIKQSVPVSTASVSIRKRCARVTPSTGLVSATTTITDASMRTTSTSPSRAAVTGSGSSRDQSMSTSSTSPGRAYALGAVGHYNSSAVGYQNSSASSNSQLPRSTLYPVLSADANSTSIGSLTPKDGAALYYGHNNTVSSNASAIVQLTMNFTSPAVVLDQTTHVTNVSCTDSTLTGIFSSSEALSHAQTEWPLDQGNYTSLLLITAESGCSPDGHNIFFVATSFVFDQSTLSVTASGSIESASTLTQQIAVAFGDLSTSQNSTAVNSTELGCSSPSSSTIDGLPAVSCGKDFDETLDGVLGYYPIDSADANNTLTTLIKGNSAIISASQRRGFFDDIVDAVSDAVSDVADTVSDVVSDVADTVSDVVSAAADTVDDVADAIGDAVSAVASEVVSVATAVASDVVAVATDVVSAAEAIADAAVAIGEFLVTGEYQHSLTISLNIAPDDADLTTSPWGSAYEFYSWTPGSDDSAKVTEAQQEIAEVASELLGGADTDPGIQLWCVDCGITGEATVTGAFTASLTDGFTEGEIGLTGNLYAGLFLGINALAEYEATTTHNLISTQLGGFEIPEIVSLGPVLSLGISAGFDIQAVGQVLVGASLTWSDFNAVLNLLDSSGSEQSGWTPAVNETVQAYGSVTTTVTLGLPVSIGFEIDVLDGTWTKEIALTDTPGITASLEFDADISSTDGTSDTTPADGCVGFAWSVGLVNTVALNMSDVGLDTYTLDSWSSPSLLSGCLGESVSSSNDTSTSTATGATAATGTGSNTGSAATGASDGTGSIASSATTSTGTNFTVPYSNNTSTSTASNSGSAATGTSDGTGSIASSVTTSTSTNFTISYSNNTSTATAGSATIDTSNGTSNSTGSSGLTNTTSTGTNFTAPYSNYTSTATASNTGSSATGNSSGTSNSTGYSTLTSTTSTGTNATVSSTSSSTISTSNNSVTISSSALPDGYTTVTITDVTGLIQLNPSTSGSLFISYVNDTSSLNPLTGGAQLVVDKDEDIISRDSASRLLYYFPSTISTVGASRLRLGEWGSIPEGAQFISLVPAASRIGPVLVAVDASANAFYPFVCSLEGQLNKVFLVKDFNNGASILMDSDLVYTVIGGVAEKCTPLVLVAEGLPAFTA